MKTKWTCFKDERPKQKRDSFGKPRQLLVGTRDYHRKFFSYEIAYVNIDNEIIGERGMEVNLTFYTHWMEIPEVPEW